MPFVSKTKLAQLEKDAFHGGEVKQLEKKHKKEIDRLNIRHKEELEDLQDESDRKLHIVKRDLQKAELKLDDIETDLRDELEERISELDDAHEKEVEAERKTTDEAQSALAAIEEKLAEHEDITRRELSVKDKELEVYRAAKLVKSREEAVEKAERTQTERQKSLDDSMYKSGYTDGVADTIREQADAVAKAQERGFDLAEKVVEREQTVIVNTAPQQNKQKGN